MRSSITLPAALLCACFTAGCFGITSKQALTQGESSSEEDAGEDDSAQLTSTASEDTDDLPPQCSEDEDCEDDNACTLNVCDEDFVCVAEDKSASCDDEDACTDDYCDTETGCRNEPITGGRLFFYEGEVELFEVPMCVSEIRVIALGAEGGLYSGFVNPAYGGRAEATIQVEPGEVLEVRVGGRGFTSNSSIEGGFNGGGGVLPAPSKTQLPSYSCTGGGATDLRRGPDLAGRIIVAGGGGGAGNSGPGGHGGGLEGAPGDWFNPEFPPGGGGTQDQGGTVGATTPELPSEAGSFGHGGVCYHDNTRCGGGGGGWYGGGGGNFAAGGGGSSYIDAPGNSEQSTATGVQFGDGRLTIFW